MKIITSIVFSFLLIASTLEAQIPNSGFENWMNMGSYNNPDNWSTLNNTTAGSGVYTALKGTPGSPGTAFLKLISKTVGSSVVNGVAVCGTIDSLTMIPTGGFPFNTRPAALTGKWQHMIYGTSQGSIQVYLTRWDAGMGMQMPVASGSVTLSGMAMSWANFSIPLTYTDGSNPDSCMIVMRASGSAPTNNDYLWVDNLAFTGTVTGLSNIEAPKDLLQVINQNGNLQITVHALPFAHASIDIVTVSGQIVQHSAVQTDGSGRASVELALTNVNSGILLISAEAGGKESKTVFIQKQ